MTSHINSDDTIRFWLEKYLEKGDHCIDIGANQGLHTRKMIERVGKRGKVVAFEPVPENVDVLSSLQTSTSNLVVEGCAIGDEVGIKVLNIDLRPGLGFAASSFHKLEGLVDVQEFKTRITTLDKYLEENQYLDPKLIKIDVEGFELNVFRGGVNLFEKRRPVVIFEFWETWFEKIAPIFQYLQPGYAFRRANSDGDAFEYYQMHKETGVVDILCLPIKNTNRPLNRSALFSS